MFYFLCDKKLLIGVGIGLILAASLMTVFNNKAKYNNAVIEQKARNLGMIYPDEATVISNDKEETKK